MTVDPLNYPRQLAGLGQQIGAGPYGGYRDPAAQAQSATAIAASAAQQRALFAAYQAVYRGALSSGAFQQAAALIGAAQAATKPPIENAGLRAGEIVGWRVWRVRGGVLGGIFHEYLWPFTEPVVTPESDVDDKGLGVFAFKTQQKCLSEYGSCAGHDEIVIGAVHLWGLVIEHERGYRAEFARPASFVAYLGPNWADGEVRLKALRKNYGLVEP